MRDFLFYRSWRLRFLIRTARKVVRVDVPLRLLLDCGLRLSHYLLQSILVEEQLLTLPDTLENLFACVHEVTDAEVLSGQAALVRAGKRRLDGEDERDSQLVEHANPACSILRLRHRESTVVEVEVVKVLELRQHHREDRRRGLVRWLLL